MYSKCWAFILAYFYIASATAGTESNGLKGDLDAYLAEGDYDRAVQYALDSPDHYLAELIAKEEQLKLYEDPRWLALLHYRENFWGGYASEIDGEDFFTSQRGKVDPRQELKTTLASFFSTRPVAPTKHNPQCRFLARYNWLSQRLNFNAEKLPEQSCRQFEVFYEAFEPIGLTVIFPSAHPNSPSSMFGHTSLLINGKGRTNSTRMLDFTINYAAQVDTSNGLLYAVKGLSGGFIGRFYLTPYHTKLREYAQMENRDIWEYQLKLPQETVDFVIMHAWELLGTYSDYYFFTENCSYHLLALLEADMYDYKMTSEFRSWVLPTDTLRVLDSRGLVNKVNYYPSNHRKVVARRKSLTQEENSLAMAVYEDGVDSHTDELEGLNLERRAAVLDMAFDYLRYKKTKEGGELSPDLSERERSLLMRRSKLKVASQRLEVPVPTTRPDQGHDTARASFGLGYDDNGNFLDLGWRAVYHDWMDPESGYSGSFALELGRLGLRYYGSKNLDKGIKLDHFYLVKLDYYEPADEFFQNISWSVTTGLEAVFKDADDRELSLMLRGGPGLSHRFNDEILAYGLVDAEVAYSDAYQDSYYLGAGPALGVIANLGDRWKAKLSGHYLFGVATDKRDRAVLTLDQSLVINKDVALKLGLNRKLKLDGWVTEAIVNVNLYF